MEAVLISLIVIFAILIVGFVGALICVLIEELFSFGAALVFVIVYILVTGLGMTYALFAFVT